jgi:hypothetical protein
MGCYWDAIGEHNENFEEHIENPLGTTKKSKKSNTSPLYPPRKKKLGPLGVHGGTPHWLAKNFYAYYLYCLSYLT